VSLLYRSRPRTLVRCFAICTLYGCSIELCGKICKSGEGMSLFSLAARRRSLECWLRARSRALTPMRSVDTRRWTRPTTPSYLHTCHLHMHRKESSVSPTCSYRIYQDTANRLVASLSIRRTRHPCLLYISESLYRKRFAQRLGIWVSALRPFHSIMAQRLFS
jgi:hypothetical protein